MWYVSPLHHLIIFHTRDLVLTEVSNETMDRPSTELKEWTFLSLIVSWIKYVETLIIYSITICESYHGPYNNRDIFKINR